MIVWLASYPRSGNTFVRTLLRSAFGLESYSLHSDEADFPTGHAVTQAVGHTLHEDIDAVVSEARSSDHLTVIKTHQAPLDDSPAIYVVRDGRASVVSFREYLASHGGQVSLEALIDGVPFCGSWTSHFESWRPLTRPNTLLLRFEEITALPERAIETIAAFLKLAPKTLSVPDFDKLHELSPSFFRSGNNASNIAKMSATEQAYFFERHAALMCSLGYASQEDALRAVQGERKAG